MKPPRRFISLQRVIYNYSRGIITPGAESIVAGIERHFERVRQEAAAEGRKKKSQNNL